MSTSINSSDWPKSPFYFPTGCFILTTFSSWWKTHFPPMSYVCRNRNGQNHGGAKSHLQTQCRRKATRRYVVYSRITGSGDFRLCHTSNLRSLAFSPIQTKRRVIQAIRQHLAENQDRSQRLSKLTHPPKKQNTWPITLKAKASSSTQRTSSKTQEKKPLPNSC